MGDRREVQLHVRAEGSPGPPAATQKDGRATNQQPQLPPSKLKHWGWWLMVALNILFVLAGQTIATLLGRFYYDQGGNSKWMATLVTSGGFPILLPFLLFSPLATTTTTTRPPVARISLIYITLGLIIAADNLMYSYALLYLPVSTFSLICATQLAFNAVFSYFLNSQKFTHLVFNSVVLLTFSALLLGVRSDSGDSASSIPKGKYPLGFVLTVGASAAYSLILSLMQLTFQRVLKRETFAVVWEMQFFTGCAASMAAVVGLFAGGEWRTLHGEMEGFGKGKAAYVMTLAGTAISWQVCTVGTVGLIFVVSSLFSNVISTLALPVVPVFAVVFFHDKMDGVKVVALLIAVWGFLSYVYQHYLDDSKDKRSRIDLAVPHDECQE